MTANRSSQDVVKRLREIISDHLRPFVDEKTFALLDFPDHANVGDSAIYLGELAFFDGIGRSPEYISAHNVVDWTKLAAVVPDGPLFIHGGGNFGDLWPAHQRFRLEVLRRFPARQVIQLPQSIHFQEESTIVETQAAIANHDRFVLMVRDKVSCDFAKKHFQCEIILCPDMAFCLGPQSRRLEPIYDELYILRTDIEQTKERQPILKGNTFVTDWLQEPRQLRRAKRVQATVSSVLGGVIFQETQYKSKYFKILANHRLERGYKLLSSGRHITSDRLHVHILSTLLDIPHTILDNSYGKIHRFVDAWETGWSGVTDKKTELILP